MAPELPAAESSHPTRNGVGGDQRQHRQWVAADSTRCPWCGWILSLCVDPTGHADAMDYYAWRRAAARARWAR